MLSKLKNVGNSDYANFLFPSTNEQGAGNSGKKLSTSGLKKAKLSTESQLSVIACSEYAG
jgi:hypothetical protein